jgi:hypothetical protein
MADILVDSSFLYALFQTDDKRHQEATAFADSNPTPIRLPDVVLPEVTFLIGGIPTATAFLEAIRSINLELECLTMEDVDRARQIMHSYADARFDLVDCIIMAMAERLTVTQICTFDRRDFSIFRPAHCDFLELLP